jgi:hypothetical protein
MRYLLLLLLAACTQVQAQTTSGDYPPNMGNLFFWMDATDFGRNGLANYSTNFASQDNAICAGTAASANTDPIRCLSNRSANRQYIPSGQVYWSNTGGTDRPQVITSVVNSLSGVNCDGSDDLLGLPPGGDILTGRPTAEVHVGFKESDAAGGYLFSNVNATGSAQFFFTTQGTSPNGTISFRANTNTSDFPTATTAGTIDTLDGNFHWAKGTIDLDRVGNEVDIELDFSETATANSTGATINLTTSDINICALIRTAASDSYNDVTITELLIYTTVLDSDASDRMKDYVNDKYGQSY